MMNILFLMGKYPNYGGVEKVSTVLANEFVKQGHRVSIVSLEQPHPELAQKELNEKIRLYKLSYPVYSSNNVKLLADIIRKEQTNFIINQWCVPFYVAKLCRRAMKGSKCKLISVHHNLPNTNAIIKDVEIALENNKGNILVNKVRLFLTKFVSRLSLRYTYEVSDCYVVLSPSFISVASRFIYKRSLEKARCITNPITIPIEWEESINKKKEIIYVGRIEYNQKRTFRIVDIWKELQPVHPDWCLTIVGDGPDRKDLERRIEGLKNIHIEGFESPLEYYKRASILLLVSEYEGFPLVVAECMTYRVVPVVLGSYSAVYDIIEDDKIGIVLSYPYSKEEAVCKLTSLMEDNETRKRMAFEAQKSVERFSLNSIIRQWNILFEDMA